PCTASPLTRRATSTRRRPTRGSAFRSSFTKGLRRSHARTRAWCGRAVKLAVMLSTRRFVPAALVVALVPIATIGIGALAQSSDRAVNDLPNPYRTVEGWAKLAEGRRLGSTSGVEMHRDGYGEREATRTGAQQAWLEVQ